MELGIFNSRSAPAFQLSRFLFSESPPGLRKALLTIDVFGGHPFMLLFRFCFIIAVALGSLALASEQPSPQQVNARLLQMPAVSATQIAFVFAGDIWIASKSGGPAFRLSSPRGAESFPRFSPDGSSIAFSGNYEGNNDIYVMPVIGGEPRRITYHGAGDRMLSWYPDGSSILFQSQRASFTTRVGQFYKVAATGGLPEQLPVPYGEFGAVSPDGKLLAYTPASTDFATWKRYRGGMAPDIWIFNLETKTAENITRSEANESHRCGTARPSTFSPMATSGEA